MSADTVAASPGGKKRREIRSRVPFSIDIDIPAEQLLRMTDAQIQEALGVYLRPTDEDHEETARTLDEAVTALLEQERANKR